MCAEKGANLSIIPCNYFFRSIKFIHLTVSKYYAYIVLYANDNTLVVHFKTNFRIKIWDSFLSFLKVIFMCSFVTFKNTWHAHENV